MAPKIDLHVHSTASDGRNNPAELVRHAAEHGVSVLAITDHDTVDGVAPALEAARAFPRLRVIPGVEISTYFPQGELHVLGYFVDYTDGELQTTLAGLRDSRLGRAQGMIAKLKQLGLQIDWEQVWRIAGAGSVGRPHIAQAMLERGYIASFSEAFDKYIGRGGSAYVERQKITPAEAVAVVLRANGLPVMAHPFTIGEPEAMVVDLKAAGLVGIEAYYNGYTADEIGRLVGLAKKHGLIATGGSDYHGLDANTETMLGDVCVPVESLERLIALAE